MAKKMTYRDYLKQEMSDLIEQIDLQELQKRFMKSRWLDQVLWMEGRATKARNRHYTLRLITIIGGVIVPALVSVNSANLGNERELRWREIFAWSAFGLSQAVAISAAVEELFHFGENYRRYRNTVEGMKIEGWHFFQLSGPYKPFTSHSEAYAMFATHVEGLIEKDVEGYVTQVSQSEAEVKAIRDATIAQNTILATTHLQEHLQRPPTPVVAEPQHELTTQSYPPPEQDPWYDEGGDDFVTADELQSDRVGTPVNQGGINTTSPFPDLATFVPDSPPAIQPNGGDDEFLTPEQIRGTQFRGSANNGEMTSIPPIAAATATLTSTSAQTLAHLEEDEFISPSEIQGIQPGVGVNPGGNTPIVPIADVTPTPPCTPPLTTPEEVADILKCPLKDTQTYLPGVMAALQEKDILDKLTLVAAIATIGVETGGFRPIKEYGGPKYFTKMYEGRRDLGNTCHGDGARYHGRGFIQITGRANYREYGKKLGLGNQLEENPDLTLDPKISAQILACYFYDRKVYQAAREKDWRKVRKLVNGGYNGWDEFSNFVQRALQKLA